MIKAGDKFVIEIAEIFLGAESKQPKYRIKGFDNLCFDDKGLRKLETLDQDKSYQDGFNEGYKMGMMYENSRTPANVDDAYMNGYQKGYQAATFKGVEVITEMAEKYASSLGEEED